MRVLHVISSLRRSGGGPARSSQGLVAGLNAVGVETWLLALNRSDEPWVAGVEHFCNAEPFQRVLSDVKPDIVHIHGLWNFGLHRCARQCRKQGVPYVVAPRGMLEPWSLKQKWLKKRIARFLYQDEDLKYAAALHATAESESDHFRKLGFGNLVIVSPNGVNVPAVPVPRNLDHNHQRALFVSRMHPKKGVLELVDAWAKAVMKGWVCELVYTVNGEEERAYEGRVKAHVKELGIEDSFVFTGPLDDNNKWNAYARSDLFILPTYSENFGIVVAEALWSGLPVITTKGTPWHDLEVSGCGWWIDLPPKDSLVDVLKAATGAAKSVLREMGNRGRRLIRERYSWTAVCRSMIAGYDEILKGRGLQ